jgi:hypothetical protein
MSELSLSNEPVASTSTSSAVRGTVEEEAAAFSSSSLLNRTFQSSQGASSFKLNTTFCVEEPTEERERTVMYDDDDE